MLHISMGGIYQGLRTCATFILLTGTGLADVGYLATQQETLLWTQPTSMAAGDGFLALGYARGVELWDWPHDSVPALSLRILSPATTALLASDSILYWCAEDSVLRFATQTSSGWSKPTFVALGVRASGLAGSQQFMVFVNGTSGLRFTKLPLGSSAFHDLILPGNYPAAYVAVRDSTAAVVGADRAFLVRLRDTDAVLLDSLPLGAFVQAVQWAGDSLCMGFGFSGLKLVPTVGDRFGDSVYTWTSPGTYGQIAISDQACAGVDLFGRLELFERGGPFAPVSRLAFDGTLRAALGRGHDIAVLTVEHGLALLNVFDITSPFWSHQTTLPGFVRDLDSSPEGVYAVADFSGVYRLSPKEELVVRHPYNAVSLDVEWPKVAATSLLGGVAVARLTSGSDVPEAILPTFGFGRRSVLTGDRLFVAGDGACDSGVVVYRLTAAPEPVELLRLPVCGSLTDLAAGPGVVALAVRDSGVKIFDAVFPAWPELASTPAGETWDELKWQGSDLWGRNRTGQLGRWHWNGSTLTELDRFQVAGVRAFDVWQGAVATADTTRTLTVWNWQPGGTLVLHHSFFTRYVVTSLVLLADTVWAVDRDAVLRAGWLIPVAVSEPAVLPQWNLFDPPYPNPFNAELTLRLHWQPGPWSVTIVNILGRVVAGWHGEAGSQEPRRLIWRPESTGPGSSGLFLVHAENGGHRQTRRIVYLK